MSVDQKSPVAHRTRQQLQAKMAAKEFDFDKSLLEFREKGKTLGLKDEKLDDYALARTTAAESKWLKDYELEENKRQKDYEIEELKKHKAFEIEEIKKQKELEFERQKILKEKELEELGKQKSLEMEELKKQKDLEYERQQKLKEKEIEEMQKLKAKKLEEMQKLKVLEIEEMKRQKDAELNIRREELRVEHKKLEMAERKERERIEKENRPDIVSSKVNMPRWNMEKDDLVLYLEHFEHFATTAGWKETTWAAWLLSGLPDDAYNKLAHLPVEEKNNYDVVRQTLLKAYFVDADKYREAMRSTTKRGDETFESYVHRIKRNFNYWATLHGTDTGSVNDVLELFFLEQFFAGIHPSITTYVKNM